MLFCASSRCHLACCQAWLFQYLVLVEWFHARRVPYSAVAHMLSMTELGVLPYLRTFVGALRQPFPNLMGNAFALLQRTGSSNWVLYHVRLFARAHSPSPVCFNSGCVALVSAGAGFVSRHFPGAPAGWPCSAQVCSQ